MAAGEPATRDNPGGGLGTQTLVDSALVSSPFRARAPRSAVGSRVSAASAVTSNFVGVTIVAAITTISDAVLGVIRLATHFRDPFRGLRRLHKPMPGRITLYWIPTTDPTTRDLPQGADPRAWSWRAARPRRVQRRRT